MSAVARGPGRQLRMHVAGSLAPASRQAGLARQCHPPPPLGPLMEPLSPTPGLPTASLAWLLWLTEGLPVQSWASCCPHRGPLERKSSEVDPLPLHTKAPGRGRAGCCVGRLTSGPNSYQLPEAKAQDAYSASPWSLGAPTEVPRGTRRSRSSQHPQAGPLPQDPRDPGPGGNLGV